MNMSMILMIFIAAGAVLGGVDKILGNRFGLGQKFDNGFLLMGSMALSMTGIICLAPMLSGWLGSVIRPAFSAVGIDAAMFGCVLAIDIWLVGECDSPGLFCCWERVAGRGSAVLFEGALGGTDFSAGRSFGWRTSSGVVTWNDSLSVYPYFPLICCFAPGSDPFPGQDNPSVFRFCQADSDCSNRRAYPGSRTVYRWCHFFAQSWIT